MMSEEEARLECLKYLKILEVRGIIGKPVTPDGQEVEWDEISLDDLRDGVQGVLKFLRSNMAKA